MPLTKNNYYNPFAESFLGFLTKNPPMLLNDSQTILEDVDLYYQPVPHPIVAGIFSGIMVIMLILGMYLHLEVFIMVRKEDSILREVTKTYVFAQMTLGPVAIFTICITNFVHTFPPIMAKCICPLIWFSIYFCVNLISFHSVISATMRYLFIVHTESVNSYGKEKMKKIFYVISILMPLLVTFWKAIDGSELDSMSFINKCYGRHHKTFLFETSAANVFKKNFCEVTNYAELEIYDQFIALGKQIFCMASTATMVIMGFNVTECFIYYKLFSHMNR